jgi:hypothetical protein
LCAYSNPFHRLERRREAQKPAQRKGSPEGLPFGAGLGWREVQRRGLGTAQVPNDEKAAEPLPVQPCECFGWSILVRHHYGDCGLRVVNIECATSGNQFHQSRAAVVVADIESKGQAGFAGLPFADGKTEHPANIPKPSGFILPGHVGRHGHVCVINGAGEKNREADTRLLCGFGDFNLEPVSNGMGAGIDISGYALDDSTPNR